MFIILGGLFVLVLVISGIPDSQRNAKSRTQTQPLPRASGRVTSPPNTPTTVPRPTPSTAGYSRDRRDLEAMLRQASTVIQTNSPRVGTRYEGRTKIDDYVLDREALGRARFSDIASQMDPLARRLASAPNVDDREFAGRTYYNAALLALSIPCVTGQEEPATLDQCANASSSLTAHPAVASWLSTSAYASCHRQLIDSLTSQSQVLSRMSQLQASLTTLEQSITSSKSELERLESRLNLLDRLNDVDGYNALVAPYNQRLQFMQTEIRRYDEMVNEYNSLVAQYNAGDLAVAFNRCLDPSVLFKDFRQVDLTSSAADPSTR